MQQSVFTLRLIHNSDGEPITAEMRKGKNKPKLYLNGWKNCLRDHRAVFIRWYNSNHSKSKGQLDKKNVFFRN